MSEFNNRISAQRQILSIVNKAEWKEELFGLSSATIDRWIQTNQLDSKSLLVKLIKDAADKLFFLGNKSQEQITEEYQLLSADVAILAQQIKTTLSS